MRAAAPIVPEGLPASRAAAGAGRALAVEGLSHRFGAAQVLDGVSFDVAGGHIAALLGPSGCGKTTILRAVAGLVRPDAGRIRLGEERLDPLPARRRRVGMVFQSYALFPHLTVSENVAYGLAAAGTPRAERRARVGRMLAMVRLEKFADRLPRELSGGQQQRAAVARALAIEPAVLLLDEPFAALDKDLRLDLQIELVRLQKSLAITTVLVTHDQEEALSIADQVLVMQAGRIEQQGAPTDLYDRPANLFVSCFVGRTSVLRGTVQEPGPARSRVLLAGGDVLVLPRPLAFVRGSEVAVTVRPEHVAFAPAKSEATLSGTLAVSLPLGPSLMHEVRLDDGTPVKLVEPRHGAAPIPEPGSRVHVHLDPACLHVFPAASASDPAR